MLHNAMKLQLLMRHRNCFSEIVKIFTMGMNKEIRENLGDTPEKAERKILTDNLKEKVGNFFSAEYALVRLLPYESDIQPLNSAV